jgi:hypothetical protein
MAMLLMHCEDKNGVAELGARISAAVLQQLQQAGLLQHLPAMITLETQGLVAATTPLHELANLGSSRSRSGSISGSNNSTSSSGSVGGRSSSTGSAPPSSISDDQLDMDQVLQSDATAWAAWSEWEYSSSVLSIYSSLLHLMRTCGAGGAGGSGGNVGGAAECLQPAPAALQLMLTAFETLPLLQKQLNREDMYRSPVSLLPSAGITMQGLWVRSATTLFWQIQRTIDACQIRQVRQQGRARRHQRKTAYSMSCCAPLRCTAA